ncbi:MAG: hypothetical protein J0M29_10630 [Chitinophagales bacterium]|nr:hypothetical protein [Chitinophagales bacterium]
MLPIPFFMKPSFQWLLALSIPALLLHTTGCYFDNVQELHPELLLENSCDTTVVMSYQTDIKPILSGSCGANNSCHNTGGAGGGVVLEQYAGVKAAAANGKLLSSITWDGNASFMPKGSPTQLSDCSIAKINKWIQAGSPDN